MNESMLEHIGQFVIWISTAQMPHTPLGIIESPPLSLFGGGIHFSGSVNKLLFLVFCSLTCDNYPPSLTSASTKSLLNKTQKKKINKLELS